MSYERAHKFCGKCAQYSKEIADAGTSLAGPEMRRLRDEATSETMNALEECMVNGDSIYSTYPQKYEIAEFQKIAKLALSDCVKCDGSEAKVAKMLDDRF